MAHLEATLMHTTNNHFKTLFRAICGFTGLKTPKIRPKKARNQLKYPNLAIKLERKVLETPFLHKHMQSVQNVPKTDPQLTSISNMTTFNIRPTPKIFFDTLHYPY